MNNFRKILTYAIEQDGFPDKPASIKKLNEIEGVGFVIFSDSILIYTKKDKDKYIQKLIEIVGWLTFFTMYSNTRIRGGISYGEAYINRDEGLYLGDPIIEAVELEKKQEWAGVALTKKIKQRIPDYYYNYEWWIVPYNIPLKNGVKLQNTFAVDWTRGNHNELPLVWNKSNNIPPNIKKAKDEYGKSFVEKFINTYKFHENVCWWCKKRNSDLKKHLESLEKEYWY